MKKTLLFLVLAFSLTATAFADGHLMPGMEAKTFSVLLSPSKSVPPVVGSQEMGAATIQFNIHRDMDGMVDMVIVDFRVNYTLGSEQTIRAMHIHEGAAGMTGPVAIDAAFGDPATAPAGSGSFFRHNIIDDSTGIETIMEIIEHPEQYYLNVHTAAYPAGHIRGQLMSADAAKMMAQDTNMGVKMNAMKLDQLESMLRVIADGLGLTLPTPAAQ
jgi:hypothetical protein